MGLDRLSLLMLQTAVYIIIRANIIVRYPSKTDFEIWLLQIPFV